MVFSYTAIIQLDNGWMDGWMDWFDFVQNARDYVKFLPRLSVRWLKPKTLEEETWGAELVSTWWVSSSSRTPTEPLLCALCFIHVCPVDRLVLFGSFFAANNLSHIEFVYLFQVSSL